jgi:S-adenosylmethionine decarboxylase
MGETFGVHLMLDGYGCDRSKLESEAFVYRFLDEFPDDIGMTKIMPPSVLRYDGADSGECGISGFVLIAESHVSIHTFPSTGYVSIDIFSCKSFDLEAAEEQIVDRFDIARFDKNVLDRGVEYPRDAVLVGEIVDSERDSIRLKAVGAAR